MHTRNIRQSIVSIVACCVAFWLTTHSMSARMPVASQLTQAQASTPIWTDHFETGYPTLFGPFADNWDGSGSTTTLSIAFINTSLPTAQLEPNETESQINTAIAVTYDIATEGSWNDGPGYGGLSR
ncbi:MAG: hypothetical protein AAF639_21930, partial [Chloroflexota bacterium]